VTIDILSIPDCPNHAPTVERVKAVLSHASIQARVREVLITDTASARTRGFMGSPTVLVNGKDIERLELIEVGLSCRVYANGSGVPPEELLRNAINAANKHGEKSVRVAEKATPIAAMIAAFSALACCMPFGLLGAVGLVGFSIWAAKYRLLFIGLAFALLAVGFVQVYRGRKSCRIRNRSSEIILWVAVALVLLIFLLPQLVATILARWS